MGALLGILGVILVLGICLYQGIAHGKAYQASKDLLTVSERLDKLQHQVDDLKRELEAMKRKQ